MKESKLPLLRELITSKNKRPEDLRLIYKLLSTTPINKNFIKLILQSTKDRSIVDEICREFKYKLFPKSSVIFEQGDTNTEYLYFILKGEVGVFIKNQYHIALKQQEAKENYKAEDNQRRTLNKASSANQLPLVFPAHRKGILGFINKERIWPDQLSHVNFSTLYQNSDRENSFFHAQLLIEKAIQSQSAKYSLPVLVANENEDRRSPDLKELRNSSVHKLMVPLALQNEAVQKLFMGMNVNDSSPMTENEIAALISEYGNKVRNLGEWTFFGELSKEICKPRTATIVALKNTEILRIKQTEYQALIKEALKEKKHKRLNFLIKSLHLSHSTSDIKLITPILPLIQNRKVKKGEVVVFQGATCELFFIFQKGEFKITKMISNEPRSSFYNAYPEDKAKEITRLLSGSRISIGLCGPNEFIGEEYLFGDSPVFDYNVECASLTGKILTFKSDILKTMPTRFREVWKSIYQKKRLFRIHQFQRTLNYKLSKSPKLNCESSPRDLIKPYLKLSENGLANRLNDSSFFERNHMLKAKVAEKIRQKYDKLKKSIQEEHVTDFQSLIKEDPPKDFGSSKLANCRHVRRTLMPRNQSLKNDRPQRSFQDGPAVNQKSLLVQWQSFRRKNIKAAMLN